MKAIITYLERLISVFPEKTKFNMPQIVIPAEKPKKVKNPFNLGYRPNPGCSWNPVLKYPRNELCYCKSGKKAKKCCLLRQPLAIDSEFAQEAKPLIETLRGK